MVIGKKVLIKIAVIILLLVIFACSPLKSTVPFQLTGTAVILPTRELSTEAIPRSNSTQTVRFETPETAIPARTESVVITSTSTINATTVLGGGVPDYLKINLEKFSQLKSFEYYILYQKDEELHILSKDGSQDIFIGTGQGLIQSVTYDGKVIGTSGNDVAKWEIFDFESHQFEMKSLSIPKPHTGECHFESISPDQRWAAILCTEVEQSLFLENLEDHRVVMVPGNSFYSVHWSPNGQFVIYFRNNINLFPGQFGDGSGEIVLVDTSCLSVQDTCQLKTYGPFSIKEEPIWGPGPYTWSPDGRYFAFPSGTYVPPIIIFDLTEKRFSKINIGTNDGSIDGMAWSPDGKWIACSMGNEGISLLPSQGGKAIKILNIDKGLRVFGWLSTYPKPKFNLGSFLFITGAGNNLNVRNTPSIKSDIVSKLYTEDQIELIDGPITADNYNWWKIHNLGNGIEGWTVENTDWYAIPK